MDDLERAEKSNRLLKIIAIAALIAVVSLAYSIGRYSSKEDASTPVNTEQQETQSSSDKYYSESTEEQKKSFKDYVQGARERVSRTDEQILKDIEKRENNFQSVKKTEKDFSKEDDEKNIFEKIDDFFKYVSNYNKKETKKKKTHSGRYYSELTDEEKEAFKKHVQRSIEISNMSPEEYKQYQYEVLNDPSKRVEKDFSNYKTKKTLKDEIKDFFEYILAYGKDEIQEQEETNDLEDDKNESETKTSSGHYRGQNPELDKQADEFIKRTLDYLSKTPEERIKENEDFKKELENN